METVVVVMSTYNGEKYLRNQVESIFNQKGVKVICYIRDDGSTDKTINMIEELQEKYINLIYEKGQNVGWEKSFLLALKNAPEAKYYAFSDQDDIWFDDKLITAVTELNIIDKSIPLLFHCNKLSVDGRLVPLEKQVKRHSMPLNHKNCWMQEFAQGCSMVFNTKARNLVLKHVPHTKIAHDFYVGLLCYLFGQIIYMDRPYFYHISHGTNASGEGHVIASRLERLRKMLSAKSVYYNPAKEILEGYKEMLQPQDLRFLELLGNYKKCFKYKLKLLLDFQFRRFSVIGTVSLKIAILFNKL